jgi:hypothetical protein
MKRILPLLILLVTLPVFAADVDYFPKVERLEVSAAFTPPHNEPVVQDMVARYKAELDTNIRFLKRFTFDTNAKLWFLQNWRTGEVVGHGFPEAWRNSDWNFERVRLDYNLKLGVDIYGPIQAFVEHNKWAYVTESKPSKISDYYWMTGIRYRMK